MQNIRTDLAVEAHELSRREAKNVTEIDGVISDVRTEDGITVTNIEITNENGSKALGKGYARIDRGFAGGDRHI